MTKLSQYFNDENFTMIMNHIVLKATFQNKIIDRRSIKLNEWFMFLFTYLSRMTIIYRSEKSHNNVDNLFRIFIDYIDVCAYSVATITTNNEFLIEFRDALIINSHFHQIYEKLQAQMIEDSKNSMYHSYRLNLDFEFLYLINHLNSNRVCILASMKRRVMKYAHDNHAYDDFYKIIDCFKQTTHFFKMQVKINRYIESCSTCQLSKSIKKSFYE